MNDRCAHCGGNLVFEPLEYEPSQATDGFTGFELKCFSCGRVRSEHSLQELALVWGIPLHRLAQMQWSTLTTAYTPRAKSLIRRVVDYLADERG